MREYYGKINFAAEYLSLTRRQELTERLEKVVIDFAEFSVDTIGNDLVRIFIYTIEKSFTEEQVRHLRNNMNGLFDIKNTLSDEVWKRDVRYDTGKVHWTRMVKDYYKDPKADLFILIEDVALGKCKLVRKEVTKTVFEMDCSEEKVV